MYHDSYPGAQKDRWGRVLPPLPTKPYISVREEYRRRTTLRLKPHDDNPLAGDVSIEVRIVRAVSVSHGPPAGSQKLVCRVVKGPGDLIGNDVFLLLFDPLHVALDDLLIDFRSNSISYCFVFVRANSSTSRSGFSRRSKCRGRPTRSCPA